MGREAAAHPARLHPPPAGTRWPRPIPRFARSSRGKPLTNATTRGWARSSRTTTRATTPNVRVLLGGVLAAHRRDQRRRLRGRRPTTFLHSASHPTLERGYVECGYVPMVELLRYLEANGFSNYIASGGGRDFMRPVSPRRCTAIPRDRVIGSSTTLDYVTNDDGGTDHAQAGGRRPGRRAGEADPHLEPRRSAAGRSPAATPTATCRCSASPVDHDQRCGCSSSTTTPSANSTTSRVPRRLSSRRQGRWLDRRQHQERLVDGLRRHLNGHGGYCH